MQVYRLPASLRHVRGSPARRLLRKLRPRCRPSPAVAASPVPFWTDDPSSRVPIHNLCALRRWAIPLAMRRMGPWECFPSQMRSPHPAARSY